jgi:hypothetical protein
MAIRIQSGINHEHGRTIADRMGHEEKNFGEVNLGVLYKGEKLRSQRQICRLLLDAIHAYCGKLDLDSVEEITRIAAAYKEHAKKLQEMPAPTRPKLVGLDNRPLSRELEAMLDTAASKARVVVSPTELEPT